METTTILAILTLLFGGGFIGTMVKIFVIDKKKNDADTKKVETDIEKQKAEIEKQRLAEIGENSKLLSDLLHESKTNLENSRVLQNANNNLLSENDGLKIEVLGFKAIVGNQDKERKEWRDMLRATLDANAEMKIEFRELLDRFKIVEMSDKQCKENVKNLEGRLNVLVGILRKNNLEMPEGFVWTNSETNQVYPNTNQV